MVDTDFEGLGVQGGTSPYIVQKHFDMLIKVVIFVTYIGCLATIV